MGKYALLVTIAAALALSLYARQSRKLSTDAAEEIADRQKIVIARQIARSAYDSGVSEVKRQFGVGLNQCKQNDGGTFELTTSPVSGDTVQQIQVVGRYGTDECSCTDCPQYSISSEAVVDVNGSFSAVTFDASLDLEDTNLSGGGSGPVISGNDAANEQDRTGVSLSEAGDETTMREKFCGRSESDVRGMGGICDVIHDSDIDLEPLNDEVSDLAEDQAAEESKLCGIGSGKGNGKGKSGSGGGSVGSSENPAVVKVEGDCTLAGNSGGTGILYVDGGSLTMKGNSEWKGMILIAGEEGFKTSKGTPRVEGSLAFYQGESPEGGSLDMRGTASIQYNSDRINEVQEELEVDALEKLLDSPAREEVRVINQSQGVKRQ